MIVVALLLVQAASFRPPFLSPMKNVRLSPLSLSSSSSSSSSSSKMDSDVRRMDKILTVELERQSRLKAELEQVNGKMAKINMLRDSYLKGMEVTDAQESVKETTARSAVKSFCWRLIAGSVTFFTSLKFSGSIKTALTIVGSDFFSKAATMFIGERLMNNAQAGRSKGGDDVGRSLVKALIWRLFALANTLTMAIFISKDLSIASKIASSDAVIKTAMMFVYERAWAGVEWGKKYDVDFSI
ncbi:hypothetical protein TrCOL_g7794 [Triparma columacea]|uniref:DUF2061 domain-containing protein n=1 Tax=Triparma columacea TaxID=722753 RepID=A0A9W7GET0_9STRA|nr:hypothetical protein TrCOL_g7794 [Triparma columacea]